MGYDEPLLHTMYVDKHLSGIRAVQTLSRLNRFHPKKPDTFVLDFMNSTDIIQESFADYYRTTILSDETDPDKLHDLKSGLDQAQVYTEEETRDVTQKYLNGADRPALDPIIEGCAEKFWELSEDEKIKFKGTARSFNRLYNFLSQVLPYANHRWEELSIFLTLLIPKLPALQDEDLAAGIQNAVDMETYRTEKQATISIALEDEDAEIDPIQAQRGGGTQDAQLEFLSIILDDFNKTWGNSFTNPDHVSEIIKAMPDRVNEDEAYQNAKMYSDRQNARMEHDSALRKQIVASLKDSTELYRKYTEDQAFQDDLNELIFTLTYRPGDQEWRDGNNHISGKNPLHTDGTDDNICICRSMRRNRGICGPVKIHRASTGMGLGGLRAHSMDYHKANLVRTPLAGILIVPTIPAMNRRS